MAKHGQTTAPHDQLNGMLKKVDFLVCTSSTYVENSAGDRRFKRVLLKKRSCMVLTIDFLGCVLLTYWRQSKTSSMIYAMFP